MPFHKMTSSHIELCAHHASAADPSHAYRWHIAFEQKARELGYVPSTTRR